MSKSKKLVSVIMSVYNSEDTLEASIKSILNQTYKNIEFLIIDDFSNDNSMKILKSFEKNNENIKVFKNTKNIGLTKSLNILIKKSNGFYIARQDADDISFPLRIDLQLNYMEKYNLDFCTTRAIRMQDNKQIPGLSYFLSSKIVSLFKNPFIHGTLMLKKTSLMSLGMYDENFYYAQDYKLLNEMFKKKFKYKKIFKTLYSLNMENNISTIKKQEQKYFANCVRKNITPINKS